MATNKKGEGRVGRGLTDTIYVDVDSTLLMWPNGVDVGAPIINSRLVIELLKWRAGRPGGTIVVWTTGGKAHAEKAAQLCFPSDTAIVCVAKPDLIVDDGAQILGTLIPTVLPDQFRSP